MDNNLIVCWVLGAGIVLLPATAEIDGAAFVVMAVAVIVLGVALFVILGDKPKVGRK